MSPNLTELTGRAPAAMEADRLADLEDLYGRCADLLYSFALHMLGEPVQACDLVRQAVTQEWQHARMAGDASVITEAQLLGRLHALGIETLRARRARTANDDAARRHGAEPAGAELLPDFSAHTRVDACMALRRAKMRQSMEALSHRQRLVTELAYFQGYTLGEIARLTGASIEQIRCELESCLDILRRAGLMDGADHV